MHAMRILIVEDEPDMSSLLVRRLRRVGYACDTAMTIREAQEAVRLLPYELVLLDRRLPDGDGVEFIGKIRALRPGIRIILVTALDANRDKVTGLDAGADDYLTKPFNGPELLARIRARLRQTGSAARLPPVVVGLLSFDPEARQAFIGNRPVELNRREFMLLEALMRRANRVVARSELMDQVYGFGRPVSPGALDTLVSRLRKCLFETRSGVEVHLVRGRGYLLTEAGD